MKRSGKGKYLKKRKTGKRWIGICAAVAVCAAAVLFLWRSVPETEQEAASFPTETSGWLQASVRETETGTETETKSSVPETEALMPIVENQDLDENLTVHKGTYPVVFGDGNKRLTGVASFQLVYGWKEYLTYDEHNRLTMVTRAPAGQDQGENRWQEMVYDSQGRLTEVWLRNDPWMEGPQNTYSYNEKGQLTAEKGQDTAGGKYEISYAYDRQDRLVERKVTTNSGASAKYEEQFFYDSQGNVSSSRVTQEDETGAQTTSEYSFAYDRQKNDFAALRNSKEKDEFYFRIPSLFFAYQPQQVCYIDGSLAILDERGTQLWTLALPQNSDVLLDEGGNIAKISYPDGYNTYYFLYDSASEPKAKALREEMRALREKYIGNDCWSE